MWIFLYSTQNVPLFAICMQLVHPDLGVMVHVQAVLQRKLVVPEVYDIMTRVQEMMVRSQAAPIRQLCSSVLLQFLLDYPVGDRRLQQHLHFIITNLSYQHETGREAAIDMLKVSGRINFLSACVP